MYRIISSMLIFPTLLVFNVTVHGKLSVLSPLSLSVQGNYSISNIIAESRTSCSTEHFSVYVFPIHFQPGSNCVPVISFNNSSALSILKALKSPFTAGEFRLLFLFRWLTDARVNGCVTQEQVVKKINSTLFDDASSGSDQHLLKTWIPLIFIDNENNFYKIAPPYLITGDLKDAIFLDSEIGYRSIVEIAQNSSQPVLALVSREPGAWNKYFQSSSYNWMHWIFIALNLIMISLGLAQVYFIIYTHRDSLSSSMFSITHGSHLFLRLIALVFLVLSITGILEKVQSFVPASFLSAYWTLAVWTYSGFFINWANVAYRIQPSKAYLTLGYTGRITMFLTPFLCIGFILGFSLNSTLTFMKISRISFFACLSFSMLIQCTLFIWSSIQLFNNLSHGKTKSQVKSRLKWYTFVALGILTSTVIMTINLLFFYSVVGLTIKGYQAQVVLVYIGGIFAQMSIFSLPLHDSIVVEEENYNASHHETPPRHAYPTRQALTIMTAIPEEGDCASRVASDMTVTC